MSRQQIVPFDAGDGRPLNLIHLLGERPPSKGPVLLVHGAGVRANIFRPPVATTFADYLLAAGYDVWLENWRASIDLAPMEWTLDQAALYDHPAAVQTVCRETGARQIKAVIHCQGSTSFTMSAVAGLVPQVTTIVSNAVSLHPQVSWISHQKGRFALPLVGLMTDYLNPQWGDHAEGLVPRSLQLLVKLTHHECDNNVCKFSSFTYGTGFPVLWRHENLSDATHDWLRGEFAAVPITFFKQIARCLNAGHLVRQEHLPELPEDFAAEPPRTDARFAFVAGELNSCFKWQGQQASHAWFDQHQPGRHTLTVFPGYGHLDVFIGQNAVKDTFPTMLAELEK
ncbi:MAG: esterase [Burkholderiales bacterium]|nr:esterase [Burkholderiales bacterium]